MSVSGSDPDISATRGFTYEHVGGGHLLGLNHTSINNQRDKLMKRRPGRRGWEGSQQARRKKNDGACTVFSSVHIFSMSGRPPAETDVRLGSKKRRATLDLAATTQRRKITSSLYAAVTAQRRSSALKRRQHSPVVIVQSVRVEREGQKDAPQKSNHILFRSDCVVRAGSVILGLN